MMRRKIWGFTVIELVAVVAIIGILAAIAYPIFADQMRKARRSDAMAGLSGAALALEKFRANCPQYARNPFVAATSVCSISTPGANRAIYTTTSPKGYYNLAIVAPVHATSYTITATPTGAQAADAIAGGCAIPKCCGEFRIDQSGPVTTVSGIANAVCWKQK